MKKYQKRSIKEQKELQAKITRLENFLNAYYKKLSSMQEKHSLLCDQLDVMNAYNEILVERIKSYYN